MKKNLIILPVKTPFIEIKLRKIILVLLHIILLFNVIVLNSCTNHNRITLGIVPTETTSMDEIKVIKDIIEDYYKFSVIIMDRTKFPENNINFQSDTIAQGFGWYHFYNIKELHPELNFLLGITDIPIEFIVDNKTHVHRGFAQDNTIILSTHKIKEEAKDNIVFKKYLSKVALHEVGHVLGIDHCTESCKCFMIGLNFCTTCDECVIIKDLNDMSKFYNTDNKLCIYCQAKADNKIKEIIKENRKKSHRDDS